MTYFHLIVCYVCIYLDAFHAAIQSPGKIAVTKMVHGISRQDQKEDNTRTGDNDTCAQAQDVLVP